MHFTFKKIESGAYMNTKNLTRAGILTGVQIVILLLTSVFPTVKISILALTTIAGGLIYLKTDLKYSVLIYAAVSILSFFMLPNRAVFVLYAVFFGNYAIVKALIEKMCNLKKEWILKYICAFIYMILLFFIAKLFGINFIEKRYLLLPVLAVLFVVFFTLFDVLLSFIFAKIFTLFKFMGD